MFTSTAAAGTRPMAMKASFMVLFEEFARVVRLIEVFFVASGFYWWSAVAWQCVDGLSHML